MEPLVTTHSGLAYVSEIRVEDVYRESRIRDQSRTRSHVPIGSLTLFNMKSPWFDIFKLFAAAARVTLQLYISAENVGSQITNIYTYITIPSSLLNTYPTTLT